MRITTVYQVVGWNLYRGRSPVSVSQGGAPDFLWFNAYPNVLLDRRGPDVELLIDRIEQAVNDYPYQGEYRAWPGPNSNTFTAFIARQVPELRLDLPPTAIGKDYLPGGRLVSKMPSGTGWQVSLLGLLGVGLAGQEGLEFNLLGLAAGVDLNDFALRLPGLGKLGLQQLPLEARDLSDESTPSLRKKGGYLSSALASNSIINVIDEALIPKAQRPHVPCRPGIVASRAPADDDRCS